MRWKDLQFMVVCLSTALDLFSVVATVYFPAIFVKRRGIYLALCNILLQIQYDNNFQLLVNTNKSNFVTFLVFVGTAASGANMSFTERYISFCPKIKQWIAKEIPTYGNPSTRAKVAMHWFGKYYRFSVSRKDIADLFAITLRTFPVTAEQDPRYTRIYLRSIQKGRKNLTISHQSWIFCTSRNVELRRIPGLICALIYPREKNKGFLVVLYSTSFSIPPWQKWHPPCSSLTRPITTRQRFSLF